MKVYRSSCYVQAESMVFTDFLHYELLNRQTDDDGVRFSENSAEIGH
jgi:hypothetical protein